MYRLLPGLAALLFALLVLAKFDANAGFAPLLRLGGQWESRQHPALRQLQFPTLPESAGYDGQFYAQLALDPTLRDPALARALDSPAYRARRIALPALAHLLGVGRPALILQIYAVLNVACWFALGWLLLRPWPPVSAANFARWFGCMFSLGVLDSVRQSLVDLPALLCLVLAVQAHARSLPRGAAWLALGHLTKETNLLGSAALYAWRDRHEPMSRSWSWLALSCLPLALWLLYVGSRFEGEAAQTGLGNFTWPLLGAVGQWLRSAGEFSGGNFDSRHLFSLLAIPGLFLQFGVLCRHRAPGEAWWRIGVAYGVLLLFLGEWVWSGYWAACRAVLPLTIAFNLLLPPGRAFWPLWVAGNITILHGIWRFL